MLAAAALLLLAHPAPAADDPRAKAVEGAPFVFAQACLLRLNVKQTPAAFAAGSDEVGRLMRADAPALSGLLSIDGADGRGCQVTYTGAEADRVWSAFTAAFTGLTRGAGAQCAAPTTSADRLAAVCTSVADPADATLETHSADLVFAHAGVKVSAALTDPRR